MAPELVLALPLAALIGLCLGLMGSGGSIVTLPVLVYVVGVGPREAVGMSLVIVGAVSLAGSYLHRRQGRFHRRAVAFLGLTGMVGAYLGSTLTHLVSPQLLMIIFAALMLTVGVTMLRRKDSDQAIEGCSPVKCLSIGAGVGVMTGFLGIGGGFLIVPALIMLGGIPAKKAIGTSLAIIFLNSVAGLAGQLRYMALDWNLTFSFLAVALLGMWAGTLVVERISGEALRKTFAWSVVSIAVCICVVSGLRM